MADYTDYINLCRELIDADGEAITLTKFTTVAGAKAWRPGQSIGVDVKCIAVFFPNSGIRNPHTRQRHRRSDVVEGSLMGFIPANYFTPLGLRVDVTDKITRSNGAVWKITSVDDLAVDAAQPIYYEVRLTT